MPLFYVCVRVCKTTQRILWSTLEHFGKVQYCRLLTDKRGKSKGFVNCTSVALAQHLHTDNVA